MAYLWLCTLLMWALNRFAPRTLDCAGAWLSRSSALVLVVLVGVLVLPLAVLLVVAIVLETPANPFYGQRRLGRAGTSFTAWKFRSMRPDADAVLAEMLGQTSPTLRGADLVTRLSDSQMAIFLAQADATGALDVAERIRERSEQMEVPFHHESTPRRLRVTVSVGVAQLRPAHLNLQALIDDAQDAVLAARQAGGNCVRAAPVDLNGLRSSSSWLDDHRARPK